MAIQDIWVSEYYPCVIIGSLSMAGLVFSWSMLPRTIRRGLIPQCREHSGCDAANKSRWARVGPVPVSALGIAVYGAGLLISQGVIFAPSLRAFSWLVIPAVIASVGAIWFTFLQLCVLRRICRLCTISHALGGAMMLVVLVHLAAVNALGSSIPSIVVEAACAVLFAAVQLLVQGLRRSV